MEIGVHLPQISWGEEPLSLDRLIAVATAAERLGFGTIAANDHLVYGRPWLDGPLALAAVLAAAPRVRLMTSVALPVVRGPFALAKALAAIDLFSSGRLDAGLGPGSSQADYALVGIPFAERWARFDEAIAAMRALWDGGRPPFAGRYYDTTGVTLSPPPVQPKGPPIWIGSWGSTAGLRRVARLADGWLASGYNSTPEQFTTAWSTLRDMLEAERRDPVDLPLHHGDDLALHHRRRHRSEGRQRASQPHAAAPARGAGGTTPDRLADRMCRPPGALPGGRPAARRVSGRWETKCGSSSGSQARSSRSWDRCHELDGAAASASVPGRSPLTVSMARRLSVGSFRSRAAFAQWQSTAFVKLRSSVSGH